MDLDSDYPNTLELVFRAYEKSLDLDIALAVLPIPEEIKVRLIEDKDLIARIELCDARVREDLMEDFRSLAKNAVSEGVRLTALKELGRTLYPRRFKDNDSNVAQMPKAIRYESVDPLP